MQGIILSKNANLFTVESSDNTYKLHPSGKTKQSGIYVGDRVMMGPNVVLATAGHPVEPELRRNVAQFNLPIHIGANVWLGAGCIVLPGVTIGENSVIGAGSVVTKDIPANVVAVGNPCRVLRPIGPRDRECYYRDRPIDLELE